jgi:virulence-associated protein VapD
MGTILCGDTFYISPNKKHIAVMYSYPNFVHVKISEIQRINNSIKEVQFYALTGAFDNQEINTNVKEVLNV